MQTLRKPVLAIAAIIMGGPYCLPTYAGLDAYLGYGREIPAGWIDGAIKLGVHTLDSEFSWNTAVDITGTQTPNILSELNYDDLDIRAYSLGAEVFAGPRHLRGYADVNISYGEILSGNSHDADYFGDNRTNEFSRSQADIEEDDITQLDIAIGSAVQLFSNTYFLGLFGYSEHKQNLRVTNGIQLLSEFGNFTPLGPFAGLDTTYRARWQSPWVGVQIVTFYKNHGITLRFEYHGWADYLARANWNLRSDLVHPRSFTHEADAEGTKARLSYHYRFTPSWQINLNANYEDWESDPGVETRYFTDRTVLTTRLNQATWESLSLGAEIAYQF